MNIWSPGVPVSTPRGGNHSYIQFCPVELSTEHQVCVFGTHLLRLRVRLEQKTCIKTEEDTLQRREVQQSLARGPTSETTPGIFPVRLRQVVKTQ